MAEDNMDDLRSLHQDLVALTMTRIPNIDRLCVVLESHIQAFQKLLDHLPKSEESRKVLQAGTVEHQEIKYAVNEEFREEALQLADALELDELASASLLLSGRELSDTLDRTPLACAFISFHEDRQYRLECLRLIVKLSIGPDCEESFRELLQNTVSYILDIKDGPARNASLFAQKCLGAMMACEKGLHTLNERTQRALTLGQVTSPDADEIMGFQQSTLTQQHESLASIVTLLVKGNFTGAEDFLKVLDHMPGLDKWSNLVLHYVPVLMSFCAQYGAHGSGSFQEANSFQTRILGDRDRKPWHLSQLQAALTTWWLTEYSGWFLDPVVGSPSPGIDREAEAQVRMDVFFQSLGMGAFRCTLSICSQARTSERFDPMRLGLVRALLGDFPSLGLEAALVSPDFERLVMEQVELFTDSFISNMPDTLRKFKTEEDDQRRRLLSGLQSSLQPDDQYDQNLERFLMIMSYAYDGHWNAEQVFWSDPESNSYGFLLWASRRQSTPCMAAFCEMLRAISMDEECAAAAHRFLLDESSVNPSRVRRSTSLSWVQIFEELEFYAIKIRESPTAVVPATSYLGSVKPISIDEPESHLMLECYLRLTAHLCQQSATIRSWILSHSTFRIIDTLFLLCSSVVPSRIRACSYSVLTSLLVDKSKDLSDRIWMALDHWVSSGFSLSSPRPTSTQATPDAALEAISRDFEEANSFVGLLNALVTAPVETEAMNDALPFPEQLGTSYRMAGIEPYMDVVVGKIFTRLLPQLEDTMQTRILTSTILGFLTTCLSTFNEHLLVLAHASGNVEDDMTASSLRTYVQMHPFGRAIEWMLNERATTTLFRAAHQSVSEINAASPDSPLVIALLRAVQVMNLVVKLQSTFLDVVRPLTKNQSSSRQQVMSSSLTSFEDIVVSHLNLISDLGYYAGSGHQELAIESLRLLATLASSRKLNARAGKGSTNRLINVLQQNNDMDSICKSLAGLVGFNAREISQGPDAPGYDIKLAVLNCLEQILQAHPSQANIAHVLLGYRCVGSEVLVDSDGLFAQKSSLFHSVLALILEYPDGEGEVMFQWSLMLKQKAMQILNLLWTASLTSLITLTELREENFLSLLWLQQVTIHQSTKWDSYNIREPELLFDGNATSALQCFFLARESLFKYCALEIRLLQKTESPLLRAKAISTLFGLASFEDQEVETPTIFDLFDFMELDLEGEISPPQLQFFSITDFTGCLTLGSNATPAYDVGLVEQLLALRLNAKGKSEALDDATAEAYLLEAQVILAYFSGSNHSARLRTLLGSTLVAWGDLLTVILQCDGLVGDDRSTAILQTIQLTCPRLEAFARLARPEALVFAQLGHTLLAELDFGSSALETGRPGDIAHDRLFQLFKVALRAIQYAYDQVAMRMALYKIAYRYLTAMTGASKPTHSRAGISNIKSAGESLMDIICDDGTNGQGSCRVAALLLLDAFARLATEEGSKYVVDSFIRTNFLVILLDAFAEIARELEETSPADIPLLIDWHKSQLSLLLTVSQSRFGAVNVLHAGLFPAFRSASLFAADPDLGLEIDNPKALQNHYDLLLAALQVITSVVLHQGQQNDGTIQQARGFLTENRASMVTIFKSRSKVSKRATDADLEQRLEALVELYTCLISLTGFLDFEEPLDTKPSRRGYFS